ncbi:MAG: 50S ribosomal protein L24 [Candidatus Eremiobacteraeota bacterium]|nr:50S ribosomal protein L24 [Candidatus Eremiobacteraeota bacterium]MBC5826652.1 50S ribosomal protein L24 [Candidatus Eremiobacteraeota bacterium]
MAKVRLAAGDTVVVLSGKDKGRRGKVKLVRAAAGKVEVEGINVVKRHSKATQKSKSGIMEKEMALPAGKVMYVCPKCNKPSKIAVEIRGGAKERVCRQCGEPAERPAKR